MYIPSWPSLSPCEFLRTDGKRGLPFPLDVPGGIYFYVARGGIYHLMRALGCGQGETVLMPDYHSGLEVWAVRAAGVAVRYYHIRRNLMLDLEELSDLSSSGCRAIYLIHYFGWPQPVDEIKKLCRERGMILIEDCAVSLLSEVHGQPLGSFGDYSIFCLYKTLPLPHGGLLVQNGKNVLHADSLELKPPDHLSTLARMSEVMLQRAALWCEPFGKALLSAKTGIGRGLTSFGIDRLPVADISPDFRSAGCDVQKLDVGMSALCHRLLARFDYPEIYETRRRNFRRLHEKLGKPRLALGRDLEPGVCPLFFPLLVPDKHRAARALQRRGIGAVELWNYGYPEAREETSRDARFLRRHVVELPIHQDVSDAGVDYIAEQVQSLHLLD